MSKASAAHAGLLFSAGKAGHYKHHWRTLSHCFELEGTKVELWLLTHSTGSNGRTRRGKNWKDDSKISSTVSLFTWNLGQGLRTHGQPFSWNLGQGLRTHGQVNWEDLYEGSQSGASCLCQNQQVTHAVPCFTKKCHEQLEIKTLRSFPNICSSTIWKPS